jgi:hypothetical protein
VHVFDELVDKEWALVIAKRDGITRKTGLRPVSGSCSFLLVKLAWGERTSSSTNDVSARRYSSIVRWNSSLSLRLTGTAACQQQLGKAGSQHTLQNHAQFLNSQKAAAFHITSGVVFAAEPGPKQDVVDLVVQ